MAVHPLRLDRKRRERERRAQVVAGVYGFCAGVLVSLAVLLAITVSFCAHSGGC